MNCPIENTDTIDMLLDYCAGKLPDLQAEAFDRHMQACTECRDFVRSQRQVLTAMDDWKEEPVSANFDRRLYERIADSEQRPSLRRWLADKVGWRPALSVGAACAALAVVLFIQTTDKPEGNPSPVSTVENTRVETIEPELLESALDDLEMLNQLSASNNRSL
jgi:anti-sigma-K factor RskA